MMEKIEYFSLYELHYLIGSFDGQVIVGLPTLDDLVTPTESVWESVKESLFEKGLVTEEGTLTQAGFVIVEVLREYCTGYALTIINNFYCMLSSQTDTAIVLVHSKQGYQLLKTDLLSLLALFQEKVPLLMREPQLDETEFLTKPTPLTTEFENQLATEHVLMIQHYPLSRMLETKHKESLISSWLVVESQGQLFVYNVLQKELLRFSQYYFLERLYSWLAIPFKKEDFE